MLNDRSLEVFWASTFEYNRCCMRPTDLKKLLRTEPFEPICLGLTDGRSVLMRHPDQVVVSERHVYAGLAKIGRSGPMTTPRSGESLARDWILANLLHITSAEPANGSPQKPKRKPRG